MVPVFGSGGSSKEGLLCVSVQFKTERTVPVPVSVPGKRFWRFRFRVRFLGKMVPTVPVPRVPVRFLGHHEFPFRRCTPRSENNIEQMLGPAFGRTDFSRIFFFEPPDFFADFLAGFFLLIFVGKSAQKNPPGKSLGKSPKIYTTKILQHISADCPGQQMMKTLRWRLAKVAFETAKVALRLSEFRHRSVRAVPVFEG